MTNAELVLRWSGGELNLMGENEGEFGDFWIETLADGTDWGNPEPVRRALRRFLLDGSSSAKEYDDNRTIPLSLRVSAPDGVALAGGEIPLAQADGRRCELVWTPPGDFSAPCVFVAVSADLRHKMDDLAEVRTPPSRFYTLTLECLPYALSDEWFESVALEQGVSTPTLIDACSSLTGWTSAGATLSIVSGQIAATMPAGSNQFTVTRTGSIDFTPDRYLRMVGYGGMDGFLYEIRRADGEDAPRVGVDAGAYVFDVNGDTTSLTFEYRTGRLAESTQTIVLFDSLQRQSTVRSVNSRQQIATIATPGSRRTSGTLAISAAGGLGDVVLYSGPSYDPTMSPGTVPGSSRRIANTALLSGAYDQYFAGNETSFYRRPVTSLPKGSYAVWVRAFNAAGPAGVLSFKSNLRTAGGTLVDSRDLGAVLLPDHGDYELFPVGGADLPGWELPTSSSLIFEIEATWEGSFSPGGACVDEILLCEIGTGSLTIVDAGSSTHLWMDAPSLDLDHPAIFSGSASDRSTAVPLSLSSTVQEWGGAHMFTPGVTNIYLGTSGVAGAEVTARGRAAHHTHPTA